MSPARIIALLAALITLASVSVAHAEAPQLTVSWPSVASPLLVGDQATFTATVANAGTIDAADVHFAVVIPAAMTELSIAASQGTCTVTSCSIGLLAHGASATIAVTLKARTYGMEQLVGTADGGDEYTQALNITGLLDFSVLAHPALSLQLSRIDRWIPKVCGARMPTSCLLLHGARLHLVGSVKPVGATPASRAVSIQLQHRVNRMWMTERTLTSSVSTATGSRGAVRIVAGPSVASQGMWRAQLIVSAGPTTTAAASPFVYFRRS